MSLPKPIQAIVHQHLPSAPDILKRLIDLNNDESACIDDLIKTIESKPELASQLEAWGASPYYSADGTNHCVYDTVVRALGADIVLHTALGIIIKDTIGLPLNQPTNRQRQHWRKGVYTATISEAVLCCLAGKIRPKFGTSYLAGLLHTSHGFIHNEWMKYAFNNNDILKPEDILLPLFRSWRLPEATIIALEKHNEPNYDGPYWIDALALHIAIEGLDMLHNNYSYLRSVDEMHFERLGTCRERVEQAIETVSESIALITAMADYTFTYQAIRLSDK